MLRNRLKEDYYELCKIKGRSANDVGRAIGICRQSQRNIWQGILVNKRWIRLIEELGYDIEVEYVER